MIPVIQLGDTVFVRFYCDDWVKLEFDAYNASERKSEQHGRHLEEIVQGYVDKATERLVACGIKVINTGVDYDSNRVGFPEILAICRENRDQVAEFGPFIQRHLARKGQVSAEEMAALYEDFHGIQLKKEEGE